MPFVRLLALITFISSTITQVFAQESRSSFLLKDQQGSPIASASITIKYMQEGKSRSNFTFTDQEGKFAFAVPPDVVSITMEINALGYKSKAMGIQLPQDQALNIIQLDDDVKLLDEVQVHIQQNVIRKGDTTTFNLDAFAKGSETVVEDLLKELPGFDIDKDGNIFYNHRQINRVLLEGDDLYDRDYKLLTKNLRSHIIDQAQIIANHSGNETLAGMEKGTEQVLNLKLRDKNAIVTEANAALGAGIPSDRYEGRTNILTISPKVKAVLLGAMNNIGEDPFSFIDSDMPMIRQQQGTDQLSVFSPQSLSTINELYFSGIAKQRNNFNRARTASINGLYKPGQNIQFKLSGYLIGDRNLQQQYRMVNQITNDGLVTYDEGSSLIKGQFYQGYRLEAKWLPSSTSRLFYQGSVKLDQIDHNTSNLLQNSPIQQELATNRLLHHQRLSYTKRMASNKAIDVEALYSYSKQPQQLHADTTVFLAALPTGFEHLEEGFSQHSDMPLHQFSAVARYMWNPSNHKIDLNAGVNVLKTDFQMRLNSPMGLDDSAYVAYNRIENRSVYAELAYSYTFNDKFTNTINLNLASEKMNVSDGSVLHAIDTSYLNPTITYVSSYKLNASSNASLVYQGTTVLPQHSAVINGFWLRNYRSLNAGTAIFNKRYNQSFTVNYSYSDFSYRLFLLNATLSYSVGSIAYMQQIEANEWFTMTRSIPATGLNNGLWMARINGEKYLPFAKGNLKLDVRSILTTNHFMNLDALTRARVLDNQVTLGFRTAWSGVLNLSGSSAIRLNRNHVLSREISSTYLNNTYNQKLDAYLALGNNCNIEISADHYTLPYGNSTESLLFADFSIRYILKPNKLYIDVKGKNLLNRQTLSYERISPTYYSLDSFNLLPGYWMLSVFFKI